MVEPTRGCGRWAVIGVVSIDGIAALMARDKDTVIMGLVPAPDNNANNKHMSPMANAI